MAGRAGRRARRGPALLAPVLLATGMVVALLAGCGAPSWTYVTNSADRTYLKVPTSWKQVDPAELESRLGVTPAKDSTEGVWIQAYDSDARPSLSHIIGESADSPAVLVTVQPIPAKSRGQISLDTIRDFIYPVSDTARQTMQLGGQQSGLTGFTLLGDEVLTPGEGIRGVHTVFSYRVNGGAPQIFDQTGYLNDDASKLYMFFVRCSTECYEKRQQEIGNVVSSFTVRENR